MATLIKHEKKFLIIGNVNALKYKEIFPLIMGDKVWLGASIHSGDREFGVPDDYPLEAASCRVDSKGKKYIRVKGVRWYTNLEYSSRHEKLPLWGRLYAKYGERKYNPSKLDKEVAELMADKEVQRHGGIYEFLLSDRTLFERLSLRTFDPDDMRVAYENQKGVCPICNGSFAFEEMRGDHIKPWSKGGKTVPENLQMLCADCNARKSDRF